MSPSATKEYQNFFIQNLLHCNNMLSSSLPRRQKNYRAEAKSFHKHTCGVRAQQVCFIPPSSTPHTEKCTPGEKHMDTRTLLSHVTKSTVHKIHQTRRCLTTQPVKKKNKITKKHANFSPTELFSLLKANNKCPVNVLTYVIYQQRFTQRSPGQTFAICRALMNFQFHLCSQAVTFLELRSYVFHCADIKPEKQQRSFRDGSLYGFTPNISWVEQY